MTIDILSPQGNVYCILGFARQFQRQMKKHGTNNEKLDYVLSNYMSMKYEEILDKLEQTHLFEFEGREEYQELNQK